VREPVGRGDGLQALVRDRLAADHRDAVRPLGEARLRTLDGRELLPEVVGPALVELVLVQLGREVAGVLVVGFLAGIDVTEPRERTFDARPLSRQELSCAGRVHVSNRIRRLGAARYVSRRSGRASRAGAATRAS